MKKKYVIPTVFGALTAIITGIMDLVLLPAIEKVTQGMRFFDMNSFGYSYEQASEFISTLSTHGRSIALNFQLPLDFVYPIIYTVFFISLLLLLTGKKTKLIALPILLFISDYAENICSVIMLRSEELSYNLVKSASVITVTKGVLMSLVFIVAAVLIIKRIVEKRKKKA